MDLGPSQVEADQQMQTCQYQALLGQEDQGVRGFQGDPEEKERNVILLSVLKCPYDQDNVLTAGPFSPERPRGPGGPMGPGEPFVPSFPYGPIGPGGPWRESARKVSAKVNAGK